VIRVVARKSPVVLASRKTITSIKQFKLDPAAKKH
jgi:hypothetical protein